MQRAAERQNRATGGGRTPLTVLPSAAARRQIALHAATERITRDVGRVGCGGAEGSGVHMRRITLKLLGAAIADPGGLITEQATVGTLVGAASASLCSAQTALPQGYPEAANVPNLPARYPTRPLASGGLMTRRAQLVFILTVSSSDRCRFF